MSRATIIIDGETRLDDDLQQWQRQPPGFLADMIKPGAKPEPYLQCAAIALAQATIAGQPVVIEVNTHPGGWILRVDQQPTLPAAHP